MYGQTKCKNVCVKDCQEQRQIEIEMAGTRGEKRQWVGMEEGGRVDVGCSGGGGGVGDRTGGKRVQMTTVVAVVLAVLYLYWLAVGQLWHAAALSLLPVSSLGAPGRRE